MRNYEAMFIFKPDLEGDDLDKVINRVGKVISEEGKGEVKSDNMGRKTFAYPINKIKEGVYVNYLFTAKPLSIVKIKESLQHDENIIRFIVFGKGDRT
jgi:small subunit ribosomal protein S6